MKSHHHDRRAAADESNDGADREIDIAPDNHQQHAESHDDDVAVLEDEVGYIDAAEEHAAGHSVGQTRNIQAVVIAVDEVDVSISGRSKQDGVSRRPAHGRVGCSIVFAKIGFGFYDAAG